MKQVSTSNIHSQSDASFQKFLFDEWRFRIGQLMIENNFGEAMKLTDATERALKFGFDCLLPTFNEVQMQKCMLKPKICTNREIPWWHDDEFLAEIYEKKEAEAELNDQANHELLAKIYGNEEAELNNQANDNGEASDDYLTANEDCSGSDATYEESHCDQFFGSDSEAGAKSKQSHCEQFFGSDSEAGTKTEESHCQQFFGSDSEADEQQATFVAKPEQKSKRERKSASRPPIINQPFGSATKPISKPSSKFAVFQSIPTVQPLKFDAIKPSKSTITIDVSEWTQVKFKKPASSACQRLVLVCGNWPAFESHSKAQVLGFLDSFPHEIQQDLIKHKRLTPETMSVSIAPNTYWSFNANARMASMELQQLCRYINEQSPNARVTIVGFYSMNNNVNLSSFNAELKNICKKFRNTDYVEFEDLLESCELQIVTRRRDNMATLSRNSIITMLQRLSER